ncbi:vitellogenin-like [Spea bombifrons]|uniref:vitellogenin-like n=1 Tax=Spea bombifrons TaxID=233779 RepID=UPI0023493650|nr:vitellogenin-like [Spea bombifrons]
MELRAVLLCAVVAGVLGKNPENLGEGGPCTSECPRTGQLAFQTGYQYTYSYSTVTSSFLQGSSSERSNISLECMVQIHSIGNCQMLLKLENVHLKASVSSSPNSMKEFHDLRDILQKHPLQFSFHGGKIQKICPTKQEPTWALNAKRGILSVFQGTLKTSSMGRTVDEVDISGRCPTKYEIRGDSIWKKKELNKCANRMLVSSFLRSVPIPDKTQILNSELECIQTYKEDILAEATCNESHLVTLFSREGNGAKTHTQTAVRFLKKEVKSNNKEMTGDIYVTSLMFEKENSSAHMKREEDVSETIRNLCMALNMNSETADHFMNLVFELRLLSADALLRLWQRSSFKCRDNWQPLLDALPSCGTEACVNLMKEILLSKELEDEQTEAFLWSLAFIPEPTAGMLGSLTVRNVVIIPCNVSYT